MIKDKYLSDAIDRLGFTRVKLGGKELTSKLENIYNNFFGSKKSSQDMAVTHNVQDYLKSLEIHEKLSEAIEPYLKQNFDGYKIFASHFVIKKGKSQESFQLHQDWSIVDENKYKSYQVWIPLGPSYPENGGMCFIPESHQFFNNIRSGSLGITHIPIEEQLYPYLSYLRLFPGEAAVFNNSTLHGSFLNSTPEDRVAVIVNIIQTDATPLYFHKEDRNQINAYKFTIDEFLQNLHRLEKGVFELDKKPEFSFEHQQADNTSYDAKQLIEKIHSENHKHGRAKDYEHKMFRVLKDDKLEKEINDKGYSIINLLDEPTLKVFREKFNEVYPDRTKFEGLYSSMMNVPHEDRKELHDFACATLKNCLDNFCIDYASPISLFYSRRPDNNYYLEWHSDPSIMLNQHLEPLYGIWFPLVDLEPEYGTLKIVPGSHRLLNKLIFTYNTFKWPLESKRSLLEEYGISFKLKAGQALIYDARMIHSSEPNTSNIDRDNIMIRVNHYKSDYYKVITQSVNENHKADLYKQDFDFFFSKSVKDHTRPPDTGDYEGKMYLFYNDISPEYISKYLDRFKTEKKTHSLV